MVLRTILGYSPEKALFWLELAKKFVFTVFLEKEESCFLFLVKFPFFFNLY
jgi:hypothetical protein